MIYTMIRIEFEPKVLPNSILWNSVETLVSPLLKFQNVNDLVHWNHVKKIVRDFLHTYLGILLRNTKIVNKITAYPLKARQVKHFQEYYCLKKSEPGHLRISLV